MIMAKCFQSTILLLLCSLYYSTLCPAIQYSCPHDQSLLLQELKQSFNTSSYDYCDNYNLKTEYWNESTDCCSWEGVTCDKITSQVIELDLSCSKLHGTIGSNSSLYHLSQLQRLNLGWNDIQISQVSKIFGNFTHLTHLNLSQLRVTGQVPSEILKLTELVSLDLSDSTITVEPDIFKLLLSNFTKLRQISLGDLNIISSIPKNLSLSLEVVILHVNRLQGELPQSIFHLPNLKTLELRYDLGFNLYGELPSMRWNSSETLEFLYLSKISFVGKIPDSIRNLKALKFLYLNDCGLTGSIPKGIFNDMTRIEVIDLSVNSLIGSLPSVPREMKQLSVLQLSSNQLYGPLPTELSNLVNLEFLDLSSNNLSGHLDVFSNMTKLATLSLSSNNFSGFVDLNVFSNMRKLSVLQLSHNRLSLLTKNNSTLPETVFYLGLASCNITDLEFLRGPSNLFDVDLSMNNILEVPSWLWTKWENLFDLNLSYNSITHTREIVLPKVYSLDLRSNMFHGLFPQVPTVHYLLISNNNFSGVIPPAIICKLSGLDILDISNNSFTGSIPHCIGNISENLSVLDMRMNKLDGTIPEDIVSVSLVTINLHGNNLHGNIPSSLAKCTDLIVIDFGNNNLKGSFPSWLGILKKLRVLSLRSNNLYGEVSFSTTTSFSRLQILDLSHNQFRGTLSPNLFKSFAGMMESNVTSKSPSYVGDDDSYYKDFYTVVVVNKGVEFELVKILKTWDTIDLSYNNFEGQIPSSVGGLISVRQLNFSNNIFGGEIPISLGNLSVLESLDLSSNQLNGTIPTQLATLHFLSKLDLSRNQLTGRIPGGPQFQTLENDSFIGNNGLCGFPLSKECVGDELPDFFHSPKAEYDLGFIDGFSWRPVAVGYGVGTLIGLGIGCLMILTRKPEWLSRIVEEEGYKILIKINQKKKILRRIGRNN